MEPAAHLRVRLDVVRRGAGRRRVLLDEVRLRYQALEVQLQHLRTLALERPHGHLLLLRVALAAVAVEGAARDVAGLEDELHRHCTDCLLLPRPLLKHPSVLLSHAQLHRAGLLPQRVPLVATAVPVGGVVLQRRLQHPRRLHPEAHLRQPRSVHAEHLLRRLAPYAEARARYDCGVELLHIQGLGHLQHALGEHVQGALHGTLLEERLARLQP
mmetsp:Transcript_4030/g.14087  ORF Transcript_4030/g.14087 Transcript_4030/m.14087 type:complete len:214 (-) Transcript_4030:805-1446(-)